MNGIELRPHRVSLSAVLTKQECEELADVLASGDECYINIFGDSEIRLGVYARAADKPRRDAFHCFVKEKTNPTP